MPDLAERRRLFDEARPLVLAELARELGLCVDCHGSGAERCPGGVGPCGVCGGSGDAAEAAEEKADE